MAAKSLSYKKAADLMRLPGRKLMLMHNSGREPSKSYYVVPGGPVSPDIARKLIARDDVCSQLDGLLPETPQTWLMAGNR